MKRMGIEFDAIEIYNADECFFIMKALIPKLLGSIGSKIENNNLNSEILQSYCSCRFFIKINTDFFSL